jgi:hypothetical protein
VPQPSPRPYCPPQHTRPKVTRVAREPMVTRNYRVRKPAWDDAMATAAAADESFAEALRDFTDWFAHRPRAREPWRPERGVKAPAADDSATGT